MAGLRRSRYNMGMEAIHALRRSTYTVEVNGSIVKVEAHDRAGAELGALIALGGSPRVIDGPSDPADAARKSGYQRRYGGDTHQSTHQSRRPNNPKVCRTA
jgi:hypothetical protein